MLALKTHPNLIECGTDEVGVTLTNHLIDLC